MPNRSGTDGGPRKAATPWRATGTSNSPPSPVASRAWGWLSRWGKTWKRQPCGGRIGWSTARPSAAKSSKTEGAPSRGTGDGRGKRGDLVAGGGRFILYVW